MLIQKDCLNEAAKMAQATSVCLGALMRQFMEARRDLLLLLSLLLVILLYPLLDHSDVQRLVLGGLMFAALLLATARMTQIKGWVWPAVLLMTCAVLCALLSIFLPSSTVVGMKWGILAAFFGLVALGLFSYLRTAHTVGDGHLYTAVNIYMLGLQWFAFYTAFDVLSPGSIQHSASAKADRHAELLYFSLVALSTVGYGDVVPLQGEVRILAALEGLAGVLYIAITVALLVSACRPRDNLA